VANLRLHELLQRVVRRAAGRLLVPVINEIAAFQIEAEAVQGVEGRHDAEQEEEGQQGVDGIVPWVPTFPSIGKIKSWMFAS
jgi:hypothetical protein